MSTASPALPVEGRLVDVGARGLRLACEGRGPTPGAHVRLEIMLEDPDRPAGPPRVVLDGMGRVVWVRQLPGRRTHAGVCFDAPVDVRRSFPGIRIY